MQVYITSEFNGTFDMIHAFGYNYTCASLFARNPHCLVKCRFAVLHSVATRTEFSDDNLITGNVGTFYYI